MALLGRREERERIERLLGDAGKGRGGALILRGEPGVGKTALLDHAQAHAQTLGMEVLRVVGVESEAELPYAALQALLLGKRELLELIPPPQAAALRAALALGPPADADRLAAYAGVLSMLAEAAERRPLLTVVDDAQWLDRASMEALLFATRRLAGEEVALLYARRDDERDAFAAEGVTELVVAGLDPDSALELLQTAAAPLPAPAVARLLVAETGGNPLALLELAALLSEAQLAGREPIERPLPIGGRIGSAFLRRVHELPLESQRALLVAAAGGDAGADAVVDAARALGAGADALAAAEAAGLVELASGTLAFRHPLVRAAVYHASVPAERRAAHRALAEALAAEGDDDRRAWQLAAAAEGADEQAAAALEQAAERAAARGSYVAQWRALERALELSRPGEPVALRMLAAARAAYAAGERQRALALVERALPIAGDPLVHADLRYLQGVIAQNHGLPFPRDAVADEAQTIDRYDAVRAAKLLGLVLEQRLRRLETTAALELAERRVALCARAPEQEWRLRARGDLLRARVLHGDAQEALALLPELLADRDRAAEQAQCLVWLERYEDARRVLGVAIERARARGHAAQIAWSAACVALLELRTGRMAAVLAAASEAVALAGETGADHVVAFALPTLALVEAIQGRGDACREHAAQAERLAAQLDDELGRAGAQIALGLLALGSGRPDEAIATLEPVARLADRQRVEEPSVLPFAPDLIEALVRVGEPARARAELALLTRRAEAVGRGWALAAAARCSALLADEDELDARFETALALADDHVSAFERARTELCFGESLRRANRRKEARPHLRAALECFDEAGAAAWASRARAELRATGQSVPRRDRYASEELTAQELQIALLVAAGKSNRDVAGAIFVSRKTVEYHLSHTYRKLNIHSRTELTRLFAATPPPAAAPRDDLPANTDD